MNIRRHLLSNILRSPDDPVADPPPVDPVPAVDPPADPTAALANESAPVDPPAPQPEPKPPGWWLTRLAEESEAKRQAELRATRAEEQLRARQPAGDPPPAPAPRSVTDTAEFNEAVTRRANEIKLGEDSSAVLAAGVTKFSDFTASVDLLAKLGVTHDDFVIDLVAADKANGHVILDALAKNPERAIALAKMPSRQRLAELVRMSTALSPASKTPAVDPPKPPSLSKAPKPAPALAPVNEGGDDPLTSDAGTDEEFSAAWDRQYKGPRQVA